MTDQRWHHTTVLAVQKDGVTALGADGQVTLGNTVMKGGASKIRSLYGENVLVGFAGSSADALALLTRFEGKLEEYRGNVVRASVELAKDWRLDRSLRQLEALLAIADREHLLLISGTGDLIEPDDGILAVGSGGPMAQAAAKALARKTDLDAEAVTREALTIAGEICIYTNQNIDLRVLR